MTVIRYKMLLIVGIMILTGCALLPGKDQPSGRSSQSVGEQFLANGIKSYEEGEYKSAGKSLQDALNAGLPRKIDSAKAHKYLAFIACGSGDTKKCRGEFHKAFAEDPSFSLSAAEAGHPIWGPVYLGVRDQMKSKPR